jgi:1,2-dihydroxy-3-keto-5-methylthiopentene dioxygenase
MRAYPLNNPDHALESKDLAGHGVRTWSTSALESDRTAIVETIKAEHGYVDHDVVELSPSTPNLEAICAKFDREHYHTEDEVRFVLEGAGVFDVRDDANEWIRIEVSEGDIILIPAHKYHRFYLTDRQHIRCMRLFVNHEGWSPMYRAESA